MGSSKSKSASSSAANQEDEEDLQRKFVDLSLESPPHASRQTRVSVLAPHIEARRFRMLVDYLVKSVLSEFGVIEYLPPEDKHLSLGASFSSEEFVKVFEIVFAQSYLWFKHWMEFFRKRYVNLAKGDGSSYLNHLFAGVRCICSRDRPFFENLLAAHSFVCCATVYFCYNGWQKRAIRHPLRVLITHFEKQLRIPFARAGGYMGLANFCASHEMLEMYRFYSEPENISPENKTLVKDVQARVKKEVHDIQGVFNSRLPEDSRSNDVTILATWACAMEPMDATQKRIIGNEWQFKDTLLASTILTSLAREQGILEPIQESKDEEEEPVLGRPPLLDESIMENLKKVLEGCNKSLFKLQMTAESLSK